MSVARTAARRRRQASLGQRGLAQVYGKHAAPKYSKTTAEVSARREAAYRARQKMIQGRKKK